MSTTWHLICRARRTSVWIGQGWPTMSSFYSGDPGTMDALRRFLVDSHGCTVALTSSRDSDDWVDYCEFHDEPTPEGDSDA